MKWGETCAIDAKHVQAVILCSCHNFFWILSAKLFGQSQKSNKKFMVRYQSLCKPRSLEHTLTNSVVWWEPFNDLFNQKLSDLLDQLIFRSYSLSTDPFNSNRLTHSGKGHSNNRWHYWKSVWDSTVCFRDLAKLNLPMVVRFYARANFWYCPTCLKK